LQRAGEPKSEERLEDLVVRMADEQRIEEEELGEGAGTVTESAAAVVRLVNQLIIDATRLNASDIHIEPGKGKESATVRMRVDGVCREVLKIPASHVRAVIARIKIMSRLDIAERRKPQDGKIAARAQGRPVELRVATLPTVNGESAVLRVLSVGEAVPFDKLDLIPRNEAEIRRLISYPHGMFLCVGPTGSGKTTTLHAILGTINTVERKIWTAEDPVEITQAGLQQVQVEPKIGFDFATALRAFLRADPDVILIGEMRDRETSHIGIEASLTGHLVFSTLHTNSAPETIVRLLDLGLDPLNFADALLGVLAQRLVRTLCSHCKEEYTPSPRDLDALVRAYGTGDPFRELGAKRGDVLLCRPHEGGCDKCGGSGYRGRTGIHELLVATVPMKHIIAKRGDVMEIRSLAVQEGMLTLMQDGILKILRGETDLNQLRRVAAE
jgi:type II secretory ATPase GspE/PulE/Tfp pilus assembly ATPase PilB-like protein